MRQQTLMSSAGDNQYSFSVYDDGRQSNKKQNNNTTEKINTNQKDQQSNNINGQDLSSMILNYQNEIIKPQNFNKRKRQ